MRFRFSSAIIFVVGDMSEPPAPVADDVPGCVPAGGVVGRPGWGATDPGVVVAVAVVTVVVVVVAGMTTVVAEKAC